MGYSMFNFLFTHHVRSTDPYTKKQKKIKSGEFVRSRTHEHLLPVLERRIAKVLIHTCLREDKELAGLTFLDQEGLVMLEVGKPSWLKLETSEVLL